MRAFLLLLVCAVGFSLAASDQHFATMCSANVTCQHEGICDDDTGLCECTSRYAGSMCETPRKSKLVAFLLQLLVGPVFGLPPGAGLFYIGQTKLAVAQLVLGLVPSAFIWFIVLCSSLAAFAGAVASGFSDGHVGFSIAGGLCGILSCCGLLLMVALGLAAVGMWLQGWITILTGSMHDGDGYALYADM